MHNFDCDYIEPDDRPLLIAAGAALRRARRRRGLTQRELARAVGLENDYAALSLMEKAQASFHLTAWAALACTLRVGLDELVPPIGLKQPRPG
jgi:transcriptional regulator with XRE-family HTH domain